MTTKEQLIDFEKDVKQLFLDGKLRSPVHLSGGNEGQLIEIFKDIKPQDWVFTTYRSHYHALLKGVPEERLRRWVLDNKSIHFMDKEYKVFSSAIVGGCLPIALGTAMAIKRKGAIGHGYPTESNVDLGDGLIGTKITMPHVYIFVGDMTASLGVFQDCYLYAKHNDLPITFVIEDNGMSTDTVTKEAWGCKGEMYHFTDIDDSIKDKTIIKTKEITYYKYKRVYPHYGVGAFVKF